MQCDEAIRCRRSIRSFQARPVSDEVVAEILDLVRHTPSSMNGQPWHFVVIREPDTKTRIAELKVERCPPDKQQFAAAFLAAAPIIIVVCVDVRRSFDRAVENGVLATGTLLLAARSRGLGSVYLSAFEWNGQELQLAMSKLLSLPEHVQPITLVPLGYPAEPPPEKTLKPLESMVHRERYREEIS